MYDIRLLKQQAARAAVQLVRSRMVVGLGHGSTTHFAIHYLAERLSQGEIEDIEAIAASEATASEARRLGIPLTSLTLEKVPEFRTAEGDSILDCNFGTIEKVDELATTLDRRAGIVAHGLFVAMAHEVFVAGSDGIKQLQHRD